MERAQELFEKIKNQGKSAIQEFILTCKAEELFLDFKRSADGGSGQRLNTNDRNNLAKAISGFGNSEGGIVVWGVDCSQDFDGSDVAKAEYPITNVKRFVSWLEGVISGCTIPPHTGVQNHPVEIDCTGHGFVVTYISKSENTPHRDVITHRYYIRAGSSFVPVPHDVLAGMFGKRPQPKIKRNYTVYPLQVNKTESELTIRLGLHICNDGPGIAESLFASVLPLSIGGPNCKFRFAHLHKGFRDFMSHNCFSTMAALDVRLPPGGWLEVAQMDLVLRPPFIKELRIEGTFGCGSAPPLKFVFTNSRENVQSWYDRIFPILKTPAYDDLQRTKTVNELLGI